MTSLSFIYVYIFAMFGLFVCFFLTNFWNSLFSLVYFHIWHAEWKDNHYFAHNHLVRPNWHSKFEYNIVFVNRFFVVFYFSVWFSSFLWCFCFVMKRIWFLFGHCIYARFCGKHFNKYIYIISFSEKTILIWYGKGKEKCT